MVKNFSRHPFNTDQKALLTEAGYEFNDEIIAPFFRDAKDFVKQTTGEISQTISVVAPMNILLEVLASEENQNYNATLLVWRADEIARKRGRFATRGLQLFHILHRKIILLASYDAIPTVENDFKTGEEFPYQEADNGKF